MYKAVHLVSENIRDFSKLRELNAFTIFEENLKTVLNRFLDQK